MRADELHAELDQAAGSEPAPTEEFVKVFLHRQATLRARRRWGVAGLVAALSIGVVLSVLALQPGPSQRSVETPAGPTASDPTTPPSFAPRTDIPVAHLELASPVLTAGTMATAEVVVQNDTGQAVTVVGCGSPFVALLGNDEYEQTEILPSCYQTFTLAPGETRFPVSILVGYTECSWNGSPGPVPCPPIGPGHPDFAPLPEGAFRLTIESTAADRVALAPPTTVQVTSTQCATTGEPVTVPDVRGEEVGRAVSKLGRKPLIVVLQDARATRKGRATEVVGQVPSAGTSVPRHSCVIVRTR